MFTISRKMMRRLVALFISTVVATLSALWWPPENPLPAGVKNILHPLQGIEWLGYDTLFHWRGKEPKKIDPRIVIVGLSHKTETGLAAKLGSDEKYPFPPPRRFYAGVIDNLVKDGAKVIAFDILMTDPSTFGVADDRALDAALNRSGICVVAAHVNRDAPRGNGVQNMMREMLDPYHDDAKKIDFERNAMEASVDIQKEGDEIIRRVLPLQKYQKDWIPSLSAAAYLRLTDQKLEESQMLLPRSIQLGKTQFPITGPILVDPVDPENTVGTSYIDFPAGLSTFPIYPFEQVYKNQFPKGSFKGKVVFIGVSDLELAIAQNDAFRTAYSHYTAEQVGGQITRDVYGVVVQAQMLNALLSNRFISHAPPYVTFLLVFVVSALSTYAVRNSLTWRGPVLLVIVMTGYMVTVFAFFVSQHIYIPWVFPGSLLIVSSAAVSWLERGYMKKMWAGTVSPAYMEAMMREGFESRPHRYEATVMFGDIRGFTTFSEKHSPEMVVDLLDKHLAKLVRILYEENGTVDKFLGDGIMAVFGAPKPQPDAAVRAVRAAWWMRAAAMEPVTDDVTGRQHVLATGFGITTGPLVCGHVGSKELSSYTLIGDTVNLAARLQAVTGQPDVIIDENTLEEVKAHVEVEFLGERDIKGKAEPVRCYKVTAWKD